MVQLAEVSPCQAAVGPWEAVVVCLSVLVAVQVLVLEAPWHLKVAAALVAMVDAYLSLAVVVCPPLAVVYACSVAEVQCQQVVQSQLPLLTTDLARVVDYV
jgi:hypothetical protein